MNMMELAEKIVRGHRIETAEVCREMTACSLDELMEGADLIRRELCGEKADLCSIINGRSGRCSEDCKFCAQSGHNRTGISEYPFLEQHLIMSDCDKYEKLGVDRYSIVTAGKTIKGRDLDRAVEAYAAIHKKHPDMKLCASHGELTDEALQRMKEAGVTMVHCNIETSRRHFPNICTTHSFEDKIREIRRTVAAGMEICCGGIIGMGEDWDDRIDMALTIAELHVRSIPINALIPVKGTPLENLPVISNEDVLRTVAIFRYTSPEAQIRIAAGRFRFPDNGADLFRAGANAAITGDMLTTPGNGTAADREMFDQLGFTLRPALS